MVNRLNLNRKLCYNGLVKTSPIFLFICEVCMDTKTIGDFISQVGFPIVVTLLLLYQQMKTSESYYQLIQQVKDLVEDNTKILENIAQRYYDDREDSTRALNDMTQKINNESK